VDETTFDEPTTETAVPESAHPGPADPESAANERLLQRIRERAYEISTGPDAGTPDEDWVRAEHEILAESIAADTVRRAELAEAREAESSALWNAEVQVFGHP